MLDQAERPSGLGDWSVRDLVAHTGRSFQPARMLSAAPPGTVPLSIARYVSAYEAAAQEIAEGTRQLAEDLADELLAGLDAIFVAGFEVLDRFADPDDVVLATRGPLTVRDFAMTRLFEIVVHTDDLARAVPDLPPPPTICAAYEAVSDTFAQILAERTDQEVRPDDHTLWIRIAAGRIPADAADLAVALHPPFSSDITKNLPLI
ncbi:maleylpyruvate isomerase family mycothiol-dependent enzyme [soil metagenome]